MTVTFPTGKELDAIYGEEFRQARDRGRDPTPAHYDALSAVAGEVESYVREQLAKRRSGPEGRADGSMPLAPVRTASERTAGEGVR